MNKNKASIRNYITQQRKQLSQQQQQYRSQKIATHLHQSECFIHAQHIAFYLPISGEADPTLLQQFANTTKHNQEKTFYLPIVVHQGEINLLFARINKNTGYKKNKYGIKEPIYQINDLRSADKLDVVITPLVGFDQQGNRLGMGGGYYDRTFSFKHQNNAGRQQKTPFLIGYAYDFQHINKLPAEDWDIPLDGIVTESGILMIQ
jgi:5-formyltetrahydrofolate cyclo-ligase